MSLWQMAVLCIAFILLSASMSTPEPMINHLWRWLDARKNKKKDK